jgi:hypothetical protein
LAQPINKVHSQVSLFEGVVREIAHAGVLAVTDAVLDGGAPTVTHLQAGDVLVVFIGERARVPIAVLVKI